MPHPFTWTPTPADRRRHASLDATPGPGFPTGTTVRTLCGHRLVAENTDMAWLWPTCDGCDKRTREIADLPAREEIRKATAR